MPSKLLESILETQWTSYVDPFPPDISSLISGIRSGLPEVVSSIVFLCPVHAQQVFQLLSFFCSFCRPPTDLPPTVPWISNSTLQDLYLR